MRNRIDYLSTPANATQSEYVKVNKCEYIMISMSC